MAVPRQHFVHLSILLGLVALLWTGLSSASYTPAYCSNYNTASTQANYSTFQSNGACGDFCDGYSYAILQVSACWCSDYTPASSTTVDLDECSDECPGYPDDKCGTAELFYYLFKDKTPAGTKGASSTSTSDTQPSSTKTSTVSTITTGGIVQTVTIAPEGTEKPKPRISTGEAVGIAVGVIAGVLAVTGGVFLWWWRKRRRDKESSFDPSPRSSSAGMISAMASMSETTNPAGRRGSKFMPIDERMEFHPGLYVRGAEGNPSRESVNSLRDDMDYSRRVLRATNPDPPGHE